MMPLGQSLPQAEESGRSAGYAPPLRTDTAFTDIVVKYTTIAAISATGACGEAPPSPQSYTMGELCMRVSSS